MRPSEIKIKDITFQFIYHNENHIFGEKKIWIDDFNYATIEEFNNQINYKNVASLNVQFLFAYLLFVNIE
jgi:hypothetical protein